MGRPKGPLLRLDVDEITKWAKTGATQKDIAAKLGVSLATIERRLQEPKYRQALLIGKGELCISLRAKQVHVALTGNVQMLKWLGEQYLGQAHAHKLVDQDGNDRDLNIASVRAYMQQAPEDGEPAG